MFTAVLELLGTICGLLLLLALGAIILTVLVYLFLHFLFSKGRIKSMKFALSLSELSRFELLSLCRQSYCKKKSIQASDEWLNMKFQCATESRLFPQKVRIEVKSMLEADYFYTVYFDLADFNVEAYLKMYDDFVRGKFKTKELYSKESILREKLPEGLRDKQTVKELLLLVDNCWLDPFGQPIIKPTQNNPTGRPLQEIVLACYHIHPDNYTNLFGELWNKSPNNIKSLKSNALANKMQAFYYEEISTVLGRNVISGV